jgi:thiol-disulfide isomerase/thioredoxin
MLLSSAVVSAQEQLPAPEVVLRDVNGRTVRLSDFKGKVVLLNFWATWCPPCKAEIPDLVKWQTKYQSKGLQAVGITYPPTDRRAVRSFMRTLKMNYPVLLGRQETKALFDPDETLPLSVVIDREGNVRDKIRGILLPEEFEEKVIPLLRLSKPEYASAPY